MGCCASKDSIDYTAEEKGDTTSPSGLPNMTSASADAFLAKLKETPNLIGQLLNTKIVTDNALSKTAKKGAHGAHHLRNIFVKPLDILDHSYKAPVFPKSKQDEEFIRKAMKENFVMSNLKDKEENTLIKAFEKVSVKNGTTIIKQGDPEGDFFYILDKGKIRFEVNGKVVGSAGRGQSFGELALLYTAPRAASCIAEEDCHLWRLDQETFRYVLQQFTVEADKEKRSLLDGVDIFNDLEPADKSKLLEVMTLRTFNKGDHVLKSGDMAKTFYIVKQGQLKYTDIKLGDATYEDVTIGPGDYIGEYAIASKQPRVGNLYALTNGVFLTIDKDTFESVMGSLNQLLAKKLDKAKLNLIKPLMDTDLDDTEVSALAALITDETFQEDDIIVKEGKKTDAALYLVREGKVQLSSKDGKYNKTITAGGYFGEDMLRADNDGDDGPAVVKSKYTIKVVELSVLGVLKLEEMRGVIDTSRIGKEKRTEGATRKKKVEYKDLTKHTILGAGSFGQVWLVSTKITGKPVPYALKIQNKYELIENNQAEGVIQEKKMMAKLNSPFVIELVNTYQDPQNVFMLMGLVQGGELFSVLHGEDHDGVSERDARFYAAGILVGLSYMHRRRVIYRDLKPENVLIDKDGYPVIIDLGFAKVVDDKTYTLCGTPLYIAPEIIRNRGYGLGADHFSYGCITYEMLMGSTPFYEPDMDQMGLFRAITKGQYKIPPGSMSRPASDLVTRLLVTDPSRRIGSLARGDRDIFHHPFFEGLSFEELRRRKITPPWKPKVKDPLDSSNFENWDHLEDKQKQKSPKLTAKQQAMFKDF